MLNISLTLTLRRVQNAFDFESGLVPSSGAVTRDDHESSRRWSAPHTQGRRLWAQLTVYLRGSMCRNGSRDEIQPSRIHT